MRPSEPVAAAIRARGVGIGASVDQLFVLAVYASSALTKPVRAFSKGMTQKLGLAACLLSGKDLYILDEPTSGLDPKARALLKEQLSAARNEGKTIFFTSHALADVDELCDQMAVIHRGELRFAGTPDQLRKLHSAASLEQAFLACIEDRAAA